MIESESFSLAAVGNNRWFPDRSMFLWSIGWRLCHLKMRQNMLPGSAAACSRPWPDLCLNVILFGIWSNFRRCERVMTLLGMQISLFSEWVFGILWNEYTFRCFSFDCLMLIFMCFGAFFASWEDKVIFSSHSHRGTVSPRIACLG